MDSRPRHATSPPEVTRRTRQWWQTGVVYQIYPRSWADGNGDGIGDFLGITGRLDYLVDVLGVDAVWVSPFYPSPQADFGYDVSDYCDVDPMFGDLDAFDHFLVEAHARGLKVIVDWVPNHTSDRHPWFVESRANVDSARRDWYVWRDGRPDGLAPNNWVSMFGGPAWTFDEHSQQWYLHSFLPEQPDLNWRNPEVEAAMFDTLRFWLDRGVDGFRIDVAQRCLKDPLLRDNPPAASPPGDVYKLNHEHAEFEHIYDVAHPDIHGLFKRIRRLVDGYDGVSPRFLVGEIHEYEWRIWSSYYGWDLDELHMPFNFVLLPTGMDPVGIRRAVEGLEASLPTGGWPNWVIGNHDEPRVATRYGWEQSRAAAMLLLTLRGTPTIYYGDELGMLDLHIPPEEQQDPWGRSMPPFGRDGCRTPMQWDAGPHGGFSPPGTDKTWLPLNYHDRLNVATEMGDPDSHLALYRRLLQTRRHSQALQVGDISFLSTWEQPNPIAYRRRHGSEEHVVVLNLSPEAVDVRLEGAAGRTVVVGTQFGREGEKVEPGATMRPWEGWVLT
jgi:glycosidase